VYPGPVPPGRDHALVIGEAVRLELRPAFFPARMAAYVIDVVVRIVALIAVLYALSSAVDELDGAAGRAVELVTVVFVLFGVPAIEETVTRGRSIGKFALGLRVVRDDGGPVRARHAVIRALVGAGELWLLLGLIAVIVALSSPRHKRLGDMLAGTYVIKERVRDRPAALIEMPPELAGWAGSADIRRLPDDLAHHVRLFLHGAGRMKDEPRARTATALAGYVAGLVAPGPLPGTSPERFLAAVLAERRSRELVRLRREQQAAQVRHAVLHRLPHGVIPPGRRLG
jgi:uncharacterized RDD family membrane protein YckC